LASEQITAYGQIEWARFIALDVARVTF